MDTRQQRTRAELVSLLADQRAALAASCENYDKGNEWEAARLATAVFNLVHDGGGTKSLLTRLDLKGGLEFYATTPVPPPPEMKVVKFASPALLGLQGGPKGMRFIPQFQLINGPPGPTKVSFEKWWVRQDIYGSQGVELSRRRLVFALRHQDGGSHIGELTDPAYIRLKAGAGLSSAQGPLQGVYSTMRQVAWEVTETLTQLGEVK